MRFYSKDIGQTVRFRTFSREVIKECAIRTRRSVFLRNHSYEIRFYIYSFRKSDQCSNHLSAFHCDNLKSKLSMRFAICITKIKAFLPALCKCSEHSIWHNILAGNIDNDFVRQNAQALSAFGAYHWQQGTGLTISLFLQIMACTISMSYKSVKIQKRCLYNAKMSWKN